MWRLALTSDAAHAEAFSQALEPMAAVVSIFELEPDPNAGQGVQPADWATDIMISGTCVVEALFDVPPLTQELADSIAETARVLRLPLPPFNWGEVEDQDWVSHSQAMNPAIRARGVLVQPSHVENVLPAPITLRLDAGRAFGSGNHATTFGCLMALQRLNFQPKRIADIGTGSGVLALAAAKLFHAARIIASEIDARALEVAEYNFGLNGARARFVVANGWRHRDLRHGPAFDLIIENLLYWPLQRLARQTADRLAPGGRLILAGLLEGQERPVLQAYRRLGLVLEARSREQEWPCLVLRRPANSLGSHPQRTF